MGINVPHLPPPTAAGLTPADIQALGTLAGAPPDVADPDADELLVMESAEVAEPAFDANLAAVMEPQERKNLAARLLERIERDIEARSERDKQYAEALKRTGLGGDEHTPGGAGFAGANKVVHPIIAESCVDFEAMTIRELFPPNGPVRSKIIGTSSPEKQQKADRKAKFLNWQLTEQCKEYPGELEQLLTQLPLGGSQYLKVWWDEARRRPAFEFLPMDDMFLPPSAGQWHTSPRKTVRFYPDDAMIRERVDSGLYLDIGGVASGSPERSQASDANDNIEGVDRDSVENDDGVRTFYEVYVQTDVGYGFGPHIVTIDEDARDVVAVYRNWREDDPTREEIPWIVEFQFIPWRGALGIGLWHLIGGLAKAATGSLRALLDSAHINNSATMLKLKGARVVGQTQAVQVGSTTEVEGPAAASDPDVRKLFMPMPFNQPSTVLFSLLGWITDAAKGVVSTAEEKIADASNNMPVGTAQALIEQGSRVFSAIHARMHRSQAEVLAILHRLNAQYLEDQTTVAELGELVVSRADFEGPMDVVPVSDPAIFSETQRLAQKQAIYSMAQADAASPNPAIAQMWDQRAVRVDVLEAMKVPNIDALLPQPPKPQPMDPAAAVVAMLSGQPVGADPAQDHVAHIEVVAQAIQNPMLGGSVLGASKFIPAALAYIQQHVAMLYGQMMQAATQRATQQAQAAGVPMTPDAVQAMASPLVMQAIQEQLQALPQVIQQALATMKAAQDTQQALAPKPPPDPQTAADMAEVERRAARDQQDAQTKAMETQAKVAMNDADNATALTIEQMREQHSAIRDAMKPQQIPGGAREVNPNLGA